jgi:hypothetical protein
MRSVELEVDKLVGYPAVGAGEQNIKKLGSAKLGEKKMNNLSEEEKQTASVERVSASA